MYSRRVRIWAFCCCRAPCGLRRGVRSRRAAGGPRSRAPHRIVASVIRARARHSYTCAAERHTMPRASATGWPRRVRPLGARVRVSWLRNYVRCRQGTTDWLGPRRRNERRTALRGSEVRGGATPRRARIRRASDRGPPPRAGGSRAADVRPPADLDYAPRGRFRLVFECRIV